MSLTLEQTSQTERDRLAFEKLIFDISWQFINLGPAEVDAGIQNALEAIGQFAGADRSYVFLFSEDGAHMTNTHEWCAPGISSQRERIQDQPVDLAPWCIAQVKKIETVNVPSVAGLPLEANTDRKEWEFQSIQSLLVVPLVFLGTAIGFIGFDSVRRRREWSQEDITLLGIIGDMCVNALQHQRAQAIQEGQRRFLELLATGGEFSEILHSLVRVIEEQSPGMLGLILLLDEDERHLHIGASVSLPEDYVRSIEGLEIGPMVGSCGTACFTRKRVIVEDIAIDPRWDDLRELAVRYGFRACWSEPVFSVDGEVAGTFAMYFMRPRAPTASELKTIETAAHLVGVAIEHHRAQAELAQAYQSLERRVEERTRELALLNAISTAVSQSLDLRQIMSEALDMTLEGMNMHLGVAYRVAVSRAEPTKATHLELLTHRGLSNAFLEVASQLPLEGSLIQKTATNGAPRIWQPDEYPDPIMRDKLLALGVKLAITVPLQVKDRLVGALVLGSDQMRPVTAEELSLLAAIGRQVGVAVENARLYEQVQQAAITEERSRLARELHDSVTQSLYSVNLYAEASARMLTSGDIQTATENLRELRDTAQDALREMRQLVYELRPLALEKSGLVEAIRARLESVEARSGMKTELRVEGREDLPYPMQVELYHITQEALNNVLKHSRAREVSVNIKFLEAAVCMEIQDDGIGFNQESITGSGGLGLQGMVERLQRIGGCLRIESAPGQGTRVGMEVPQRV
jgi:signal transduction histidine kinase